MLLPQHWNPGHPEEGCSVVADQERADQGRSFPTRLCSQKLRHQLERHQAVLPGGGKQLLYLLKLEIWFKAESLTVMQVNI